MTTLIKHPTLAELWRILLARLESVGAQDAPALARSLAISALIGRPAEALGVRIKRRGQEILITSPVPDEAFLCPAVQRMGKDRNRSRRRGRTLVAT